MSASSSFSYSTSTLTTRGIDCVLHKWTPNRSETKGIAVVYHGFGAHSQYPTVSYASNLLANSGFVVYALDLPGHGMSPGIRGYLTGVKDLIEDGVAVAKHAKYDASSAGIELPLFLLGSSMGGAIALKVAENLDVDFVRGVVMLAPMISLKVSSVERTALSFLSWFVPSVPLIPSSATSPAKQYRDAKKRAECEADELSYSGKLRAASALTCVDLALDISESFEKISVPFLCMVADEDVVVDNSRIDELMEKSKSKDKTLKRYPALHGLLCEPLPLIGEIENDLIEWMVKKS
jgi:alpha-beta hydrolase superfamily lysophospholipase